MSRNRSCDQRVPPPKSRLQAMLTFSPEDFAFSARFAAALSISTTGVTPEQAVAGDKRDRAGPSGTIGAALERRVGLQRRAARRAVPQPRP